MIAVENEYLLIGGPTLGVRTVLESHVSADGVGVERAFGAVRTRRVTTLAKVVRDLCVCVLHKHISY